jgi:hypothetical protein
VFWVEVTARAEPRAASLAFASKPCCASVTERKPGPGRDVYQQLVQAENWRSAR